MVLYSTETPLSECIGRVSQSTAYGSYHSIQINPSQSYFKMMIPTGKYLIIKLLVRTCLIKQLAVNIKGAIIWF